MKIILSNHLQIDNVPLNLQSEIENRLTIEYPAWPEEGFDCKELSTLFLTTPIKFDGRLIQYLGRVLRPAPGKAKARVYDYVDKFVGPLKAAAKGRERVYEST